MSFRQNNVVVCKNFVYLWLQTKKIVSMERFFRLTVAGMLAIATMAWSCTNEPETSADATEVMLLAESEVVATAEGGELVVGFTLAECFADAKITPYCDHMWVKAECDSNSITLSIEANNGEERVATVDFDYDGTLQKAQLSIRQSARDSDAFTITIDELGSTSCITSIKPTDKEMLYVLDFADVSYFINSEIDSVEEVIDDNKFYFGRGADYEDISMQEYMQKYNVTFTGDIRTQWSNLSPGVKSILYVYGIEFNEDGSDYTPITPICYIEIVPTPAEIIDGISFDIDVEVTGPDITFDIKANGWDGLFVVDIHDTTAELYRPEGEPIDEAYTREYASAWTTLCQFYINNYGMSYDDIIANYCFRGSITGESALLSDTQYMISVYAVEMVDEVLQLVSQPTLYHFSTERVTASNLTLDIRVENLYSHICDLSITPSNDREPYLMLLTPVDMLTAGATNEEIIASVLNELSIYAYTFRGAMQSHINTLEAATDYAVLAFGYHGGVVTTDLFRYDFTTEEAAPGTNAVVRVDFNGPYDPLQLANYNPEKYGKYFSYGGTYLMWMETITERETPDSFHLFVDTDTYYAFGEEIMFEDLVSFVCPKVSVTYGLYDVEYFVLGAAMDERGNYSEMWRSEPFSWSNSDLRPIEELIEKIEEEEASNSKSTLRIDPSKIDKHMITNK